MAQVDPANLAGRCNLVVLMILCPLGVPWARYHRAGRENLKILYLQAAPKVQEVQMVLPGLAGRLGQLDQKSQPLR